MECFMSIEDNLVDESRTFIYAACSYLIFF